MTSTDFDGLAGLSGQLTSVELIDPDSTPNKVLDSQNPFSVKVKWTINPSNAAILLDGTWSVRAFAESIGPGPEASLGSVNVAAVPNKLAYEGTITVAAGTLKPDVAPDSGVYLLGVVLTYQTDQGAPTEMAGFSEGPMFMVREP